MSEAPYHTGITDDQLRAINARATQVVDNDTELAALRDERDRLRANLVNCVARLEAYYGEDYPAVRDAKAALTPVEGGQDE